MKQGWLFAPQFWRKKGLIARALWPLSGIYWLLHKVDSLLKSRRAISHKGLVCIGNLNVGGTGKTPLIMDTAARLIEVGLKPVILSKGYKGTITQPCQVLPAQHSAAQVGDEALMQALIAPTWISTKRTRGVEALKTQPLILMDDGLQNAGIKAGLKVVVVDADYGFGNEFLLPAGPLREPMASGIARCDLLVLLSWNKIDLERWQSFNKPLLAAQLEHPKEAVVKRQKYLAFCGIGQPEKFFNSIRSYGLSLIDTQSFGDHYLYKTQDLRALKAKAEQKQAHLLTTQKDWVRLPAQWQSLVQPMPLSLAWQTASLADYLMTNAISDA